MTGTFIFDLDGTLSDTIPIIVMSTRGAMAELGISGVSDEQIISCIGMPLTDTGELFLGAGRGREYADKYMEYFDRCPLRPRAFDGIPELLQRLRDDGHTLCIATSKRDRAAFSTLHDIGVYDYFSVIVTCENCPDHKPGPGPALKAMELSRSAPERSIFVGDSLYDFYCARAAGIACCAVSYGACSGEALAAAGAELVADSVAELRQILLDFAARID
ncbi:MAG: HAD-IA family hydrolase [Bacillota bacterium]|nr:HAD-IA family hydrolase [Bacillota bacterium]